MEAHRSPIETEAVQRIGMFYQIEGKIHGRPPDERREVRQARSRPLFDAMRNWLDDSLAKLSAKSETSQAIRYALTRWNALVRFLDDGCL